MTRPTSASIADYEVAHFSEQADDWWNPSGAFQPLHKLNPVRVEYIRDRVSGHFKRTVQLRGVLKGLKILDVGCGGGLIAEPLARMGAKVTGIDASAAAIKEARRHAKVMDFETTYLVSSIEDLARKPRQFDVITALEIAEHVADLDSFVQSLAVLLKPKGLLIMSTLNRTAKSFALGIVAAEYLLNWVPRGTHDWKKFIRPSELVERLDRHGLRVKDLTGLVFNPISNMFELSRNDVAMNYLVAASKSKLIQF